MRGIAIAPTDRFRVLVVVPDVLADPACEIWHRREDASCEQVALDCREPEFYLIEPRRARRCEMNAHAGVRDQKRPNGLCLMGGQVIRDDMNRPLY